MVDSILDNVTLRSQIRGVLNLFISLQTPPGKIEKLTGEIRGLLSGIDEILNFNILFNDISSQAFVVFIEYYTPNMDYAKFNEIKQRLHYFVLQKMEELGIKIALEGKEVAIIP